MITPLRDRIVVDPDDGNTHSSTVLTLPKRTGITASQEQMGRTGTVIAVGPGRKYKRITRTTPSGQESDLRPIHPISLAVQPGDRILFGEWEYPKIEENGKTYLVMQEADVAGVIE